MGDEIAITKRHRVFRIKSIGKAIFLDRKEINYPGICGAAATAAEVAGERSLNRSWISVAIASTNGSLGV